MKQTAIDWFMDAIGLELGVTNASKLPNIKPFYDIAKKMEREQIEEAFDIACNDEDRIGREYYNETYGGEQ